MLQGARRSLKIHIINFALDKGFKICYNVYIAVKWVFGHPAYFYFTLRIITR